MLPQPMMLILTSSISFLPRPFCAVFQYHWRKYFGACRISALFSLEEIAKKRSANPKHLQRLKPRPGYIRAARPLDVCQIDHTPIDVNFVEVVEGGGTIIDRAYLTIVTDVATRCILGFCLTLEKPSALSVAPCLAQAMCPKTPGSLRARGSRLCENSTLWRHSGRLP